MNRITTMMVVATLLVEPLFLNAAMARDGMHYSRTSSYSRMAQATADNQITSIVKNKLSADGTTGKFAIDAMTLDGVVTLTGAVSTPFERDRASMLVLNTEGVQNVQNQLRVVGE